MGGGDWITEIPQTAYPQIQVYEDKWYDGFFDVITILLDMGKVGWFIMLCMAIGILYVTAFIIGRIRQAPQFAIIDRFHQTLKNLMKGK